MRFHIKLEFSQVSEQRRYFFRMRRAVRIHAIRGDRRWELGCGSAKGPHIDQHLFEMLRVVIHDFLQRGGAVVVEIRRGFADAAKAGYIELIPVVGGWRPDTGKSGQQRATLIGTGARGGSPVWQRDRIFTYVARQARGTGLEDE